MEKSKKRFQGASESKGNNRGITLVALVITIIILIILATVAISFAFGQNGLIQQAESARDSYANDTAQTEEGLTNVEAYTNSMLVGAGGGGSGTETPTPPGGSMTEEGVPIPSGFYYVGGSLNDGVVISDNPADENQGAEHEKVAGLQGNQFVWVPVEDINEMFEEETVQLNGVETTTNVYSKLRMREGDKEDFTAVKPGDESSVREPDVLSMFDTSSSYYQTILGYGSTKLMADAFVQEYEDMYESIKKYGGFYIGRYELTGTSSTPTVKAGAVRTGSWYNLRKACSNIIKNNENVTSTMIYGVEWDETMNWLKSTIFASDQSKVDEDSSSWGNYSSSSGGTGKKQPTGSNEDWSANHIYDLAGNCYDYTQEAGSANLRVHRGRQLRIFRFVWSSLRPWQQRSEQFPQLLFSSSNSNNNVDMC